MKTLVNFLLSGYFLVTYNQYNLKCKMEFREIGHFIFPTCSEVYTVQVETHTIKLATENDVDLFIKKERVVNIQRIEE